MTAGHIREPVRHMLRCWACGPGLTAQANTRYAKYLDRITTYERVVETAERLGEFSIAQLVQLVGRSPTTFAMANLAVHDMALHGLVVCVQRSARRTGPATPPPRRRPPCYKWRLVDDVRL